MKKLMAFIAVMVLPFMSFGAAVKFSGSLSAHYGNTTVGGANTVANDTAGFANDRSKFVLDVDQKLNSTFNVFGHVGSLIKIVDPAITGTAAETFALDDVYVGFGVTKWFSFSYGNHHSGFRAMLNEGGYDIFKNQAQADINDSLDGVEGAATASFLSFNRLLSVRTQPYANYADALRLNTGVFDTGFGKLSAHWVGMWAEGTEASTQDGLEEWQAWVHLLGIDAGKTVGTFNVSVGYGFLTEEQAEGGSADGGFSGSVGDWLVALKWDPGLVKGLTFATAFQSIEESSTGAAGGINASKRHLSVGANYLFENIWDRAGLKLGGFYKRVGDNTAYAAAEGAKGWGASVGLVWKDATIYTQYTKTTHTRTATLSHQQTALGVQYTF